MGRRRTEPLSLEESWTWRIAFGRQFAFHGSCGFFTTTPGPHYGTDPGAYAVGMSPVALKPDNQTANAKLSHDPSLQRRISVQPEPDGARSPSPRVREPSDSGGTGESSPERRVTTADVLEAIHRATGLPVVADYYTRLYRPETVTARDQPLFGALNGLADTMRLRWRREGEWLQFRSSSYYDDRLKEVPNRFLNRWSAARRESARSAGTAALSLDDMVEIVQLSDAQLDAKEMAEGAKELFGLAEWDLARSGNLRPHLRFLTGFTPAQRQETLSAAGLPFVKMPLARQQQYLALALNPNAPPIRSPDELAGATLRVEYTQPGWFQWGDPASIDPTRWAITLEPGPEARRVLRSIVRERTREAALRALQQVDPALREVLLRAMRSSDPRIEMNLPDDAAQIFPTKLILAVVYIPSLTTTRSLHIIDPSNDVFRGGG